MIPERLKYLRSKFGLTQEQVAEKLGITRPAYTAYEIGQRIPPSDTLGRLADMFNVTTDYLLGREVDDNLTVAAHMDDDLTPEQQAEIKEFIEFKKAQYRKQHEKD